MKERRTTARPRVPGWHPDPDGGDQLRHWNGRKWGSERRPRPAWAGEIRNNGVGSGGDGGPGSSGLRPGPGGGSGSSRQDAPGGSGSSGGGSGFGTRGRGGAGEPPGPAPVRPTRRWLVGGAVVVALVFFVLFAVSLSRGPDIPPRSVGDIAFTRRADTVCRRVLPRLQAQRPQLGEKPKDEEEQVASKVELTANGLEGLVTQLRALPVATADEARVDRWLDDWETYIAVGRRYSADLRRGDSDAPARAARDGDPLTRRVYLFSKSNGMPSCVL